MNKLDKVHSEWMKEFEEKFEIPWYKEYGYNLKYIKSFLATEISKAYQKGIEFMDDDCDKRIKDAYEKGLNESKVGETKRIWYSKGYDTGVNDERQAIVEECERLIKNIKHDDNWQDYTYNIDPVESSKKSALTSIQDFINKRK